MANALHADAVPQQDTRRLPAVVVLTALGVVYGDIGTSTLYGLKQAVDAGGGPAPETVMGIVSLIFWALLLIVGLKYAILILRADNHGEGGISCHDLLVSIPGQRPSADSRSSQRRAAASLITEGESSGAGGEHCDCRRRGGEYTETQLCEE